MKNHILSILIVLSLGAILFSGCLKKIDPPEFNQTTITLKKLGAKYLVADTTVNPGDSIPISFDITSPTDMEYINVTKNSNVVTRDTVKGSSKTSFSATKKIAADLIPGKYAYRILVTDAAGKYLGDKIVIVNVLSDINFFTMKKLYAPDSARNEVTYFSFSSAKTYSYNSVGSNSSEIDFGYFVNLKDSVYNTSTKKYDLFGSTFYALNINPVPQHLADYGYDISTWTKNATVFKKITNFTYVNLNSLAALKDAEAKNTTISWSSNVNMLSGGNVILFKTANNKIGAIQVLFTDLNIDPGSLLNNKEPIAAYGFSYPYFPYYINFDVKIQK